ncbi:MAG: PTS sugar transporter subunit IIA [Candidatus Cloacimonadaceae bacterium]|nr:PTS sugar transporter subunit IIA [Candidatus Cloacimonadaceae bacterium]MDP3114035.1 PTS sugar transporter subunit IIA [Candidatus Cloacimonadaceae bacterium]
MLLANFLDAKTIYFERQILSREEVYKHLMERICALHLHDLPKCGKPLLDMILERDRVSSTAYPTGIAIPHIRMEGFDDTVIAICFLQNPLDYDGVKVHWVCLIITDKSSSKLYLNIVATLLKLSKDPEILQQLHSQNDGHSVIHLLKSMQIKVKEELTISDIMISDPVRVTPETSLRKLDDLLNTHNISHLPVVDENNRFLGEVNILKVLKVGVPDYLMMLDNLAFLKSFEPLESLFEKEDQLKVSDIMEREVDVLSPSASIIEAVFEMIHNNKRFFSVVENGKLVGIVTSMDIFRKVIKA